MLDPGSMISLSESSAPDACATGTLDIAEKMVTTLSAIGSRIRSARSQRGMTLRQLADLSNLSTSMLSLIERGRASPSVGSLVAISVAVNVSLQELVKDEEATDEGVVVRAHEALKFITDGRTVRRLVCEDGMRGVSVFENTYQPGSVSHQLPRSHAGHEYAFVLEGSPTMEIDGVSYRLQPGDFISYDAMRSHSVRNDGAVAARAVWFKLDLG